jgi:hypothetical protein
MGAHALPDAAAGAGLMARPFVPFELLDGGGPSEERADDAAPGSDAPVITASPFQWCSPHAIPPRAWLYGFHYVRRFVSTTVAPGGVGKTSFTTIEALAMATGRPLLGVTPRVRVKVWLWNGEDPLEELQRRIMAACLHYGITRDELEGWLFLDSGRDSPIVIAKQTRDGARIAVPVVDAVKATILANGIGVVVIDPFVACHEVTENDNGSINVVARAWAGIADETDCSVELVHHVRKTNGAEATVEDGRGAVALLSAARAARALNTMTKDEASAYGLENRWLYFHAHDGKANLAPPSDERSWFKMESVDLGNGTVDVPADRVGVATCWTPPDALASVTVAHLDEVRRRCAVEDYRESEQAKKHPVWIGQLVADVCGLDLNDAADKRTARKALAMWFASGALVTVPGTKDESGRDRSPLVRPGKCDGE